MKVLWTPEAYQDRIEIWDYIAADNPQAAITLDTLFSETVAELALCPLLGQPGKIPGTREIILHKNYRLVYETRNDVLWLLMLVHTARPWPPPPA